MVGTMRYNHIQNHVIVRLSDRQDDKKLMSDLDFQRLVITLENICMQAVKFSFLNFLLFQFQKYSEPFILKLHL